MRQFITTACVLLAAGCSSESKKTEVEFALPVERGAMLETLAYFSCLREVAPQVPNGKEFLDLNRIERVLAGCEPKHLLIEREAKGSDAESYLRNVRTEAIRIIRDNPYQPPTVTVDTTEPRSEQPAGPSKVTIIDTETAFQPRLSYD